MKQVYLFEIASGVFRAELQSIQVNLGRWMEGKDPLHLHDLRVANRRTRSALGTFETLFPGDVLEQYRADFRWLHQITGEARDLDIYLENLPGYIRRVPRSWRPDLAPLKEFLGNRHKLACERLAGELVSERLKGLLEGWSGLLGSDLLERSSSARIPAREFGCSRIIRRYERARADGRELSEESPARAFHLYRILVKGLRYRMDFFQPVLDNLSFSRIAFKLKKVQDAFGIYQDNQVQIRYAESLNGLQAGSVDSAEASMAAGKLLGVLEKRIAINQKECLRQARWLISDRTAGIFQSCFRQRL